MDFYYLTGIDEPGAALLLDPESADTETLFLRPLDVERGQWEGERAKLPSTLLETTSGIARGPANDRLPRTLLARLRPWRAQLRRGVRGRARARSRRS